MPKALTLIAGKIEFVAPYVRRCDLSHPLQSALSLPSLPNIVNTMIPVLTRAGFELDMYGFDCGTAMLFALAIVEVLAEKKNRERKYSGLSKFWRPLLAHSTDWKWYAVRIAFVLDSPLNTWLGIEKYVSILGTKGRLCSMHA
jgi:hypothetical protein